MKVKELVSIIKDYPNHDLFLSQDSEGNSFSNTDSRSIEINESSIVLYPWEEGLDHPDETDAEDES